MGSFLLVRQQPHIHTLSHYVFHTPSENPPEHKSLRPVDGTEERSTLRHNAPTTDHKKKKTTYETHKTHVLDLSGTQYPTRTDSPNYLKVSQTHGTQGEEDNQCGRYNLYSAKADT